MVMAFLMEMLLCLEGTGWGHALGTKYPVSSMGMSVIQLQKPHFDENMF